MNKAVSQAWKAASIKHTFHKVDVVEKRFQAVLCIQRLEMLNASRSVSVSFNNHASF